MDPRIARAGLSVGREEFRITRLWAAKFMCSRVSALHRAPGMDRRVVEHASGGFGK